MSEPLKVYLSEAEIEGMLWNYRNRVVHARKRQPDPSDIAALKAYEQAVIDILGFDGEHIVYKSGGPYLGIEEDCVWCEGTGKSLDDDGNEHECFDLKCDACEGTGIKLR